MTPALPTPLLVGGGLAFGLVVGSFLNVVIHRLPRGESLVHPPSRCPHCGRGVRPWENVPVLSWLALRGRCAGCRAPISPRYPTIELLTGLHNTQWVIPLDEQTVGSQKSCGLCHASERHLSPLSNFE